MQTIKFSSPNLPFDTSKFSLQFNRPKQVSSDTMKFVYNKGQIPIFIFVLVIFGLIVFYILYRHIKPKID